MLLNRFTNEKIFFYFFFKDVKTEETFSSQDQKLVETTNLWQLYWDKNTPARIR